MKIRNEPFSPTQNNILVRSDNTTITVKELQKLYHCHMPSKIVNLYLDLLRIAAPKYTNNKMFCMKAELFTRIREIQLNNPEAGKIVTATIGNTILSDYDYVITPIGEQYRCWSLAIVDLRKRILHYFYSENMDPAADQVHASMQNFLEAVRNKKQLLGTGCRREIKLTLDRHILRHYSSMENCAKIHSSGLCVCWVANYFIRRGRMPPLRNIKFNVTKIRYELMHLRIMNQPRLICGIKNRQQYNATKEEYEVDDIDPNHKCAIDYDDVDYDDQTNYMKPQPNVEDFFFNNPVLE